MEKKLSDAQVALVAAWRKYPDLRESLEEAASILSLIVIQAETLSDQANELANYICSGLQSKTGGLAISAILSSDYLRLTVRAGSH